MVARQLRRIVDTVILLISAYAGAIVGNAPLAVAGIAVYLLSDNIDKIVNDMKG